MKMKDTTEKRSMWVWFCEKTHGGYLFRGNPNITSGNARWIDIPPYHIGGIDNIINGETLVCAETKKALEMEAGVMEWNLYFPQFSVKPKCVMIEVRPYYKRQKNKGGSE